MKRYLLLTLVVITTIMVNAQQLSKTEVKQLKTFLQLPSHSNKSNAQLIGIKDLNAPASWNGVEWSNGHVKSIMWRGYSLSGSLDLSEMKALQSVDLSRNKLSSVNLSGCEKLKTFNVSNNHIEDLNLTNCSSLQRLLCFKNRLTSLDLSQLPSIQFLNCGDNNFTSFDASVSKSLKTLNIQGC